METPLPLSTPSPELSATPRPTALSSLVPTLASSDGIPDFSHVVIFIFENHEFGFVAGNPQMPNFNRWANENTLLTQFFAITHPSLPNYLAMMGGDTFGITSDCEDCFFNARSLPDLIEASGRTWRTYQEDMPQPCGTKSTQSYAVKHDPFVYFDPIRTNLARCEQSVVPLTALDADLAAGALPNFAFVMPNICNSAHNCELSVADTWMGVWVNKILASPAYDPNTLIVLTWDEGQGNHGCCGLDPAGGRIATVLISPLVRHGFQDETPYTTYSLLKTIETGWGLELLGHSADPQNALIQAPLQKP